MHEKCTTISKELENTDDKQLQATEDTSHEIKEAT
jgi:hypothetical protein